VVRSDAKKYGVAAFLLLATTACGDLGVTAAVEEEDESARCMTSGDIVVSNSVSDVVLILNSNGTYKGIAYNVPNTSETVGGLWYDEGLAELFVAVDGSDRIVAVSAADCSSRVAMIDSNLNGTLKQLTRLVSGDFLVVETNNVERFTASGLRIATGGWPRALQTTGTGLHALAGGGFVHCSTGTDRVRTYTDAGTQVAEAQSGVASTTDAMDCIELANGSIATVWSGTTDTVQVRPANLGAATMSFSDLTYLSTPGGIAERANGNLLVLDRALHHIVEITSTGTLVEVIGDTVLNTPEYIQVIP
jgi:hypothetical protein